VSTFADRGVSHGQCGGSPTAVISVFQTGSHTTPRNKNELLLETDMMMLKQGAEIPRLYLRDLNIFIEGAWLPMINQNC
jgi:hypothetical protein